MDAISKILGLHLTVAREQLELMQNGYRINLPADDAGLDSFDRGRANPAHRRSRRRSSSP